MYPLESHGPWSLFRAAGRDNAGPVQCPVRRDAFTGLALDDLTGRLGSRTRALAARKWLYAATPVPTALPERIPGVRGEKWAALRASAPLPPWTVVGRRRSADGTTKMAVDLAGATVEAVLIPARGRSTVCVSSQAGCTRHCRFCATATLGFTRPLSAGEIVLQYLLARAEAPPEAPARNVVFMGMGEPMDNLDAVLSAVDLLTDEAAPRLSARNVTVSTAGVVPGMRRFLRQSKAQLALSLNATTDALRERLMPHNRVWPIAALLDVLREDHARGSGRRYFIEYVLWRDVNDADADADRLAALLEGLPAHVNLIPHNAYPGSELRSPGPARVRAFQRRLQDAGLRSLVREPRGREIAAACGQLALG
jgi:23S rRNA (adenine2503-C2)-methyltransferase